MEWKNKRVLITGISGFIGSNLGKKLLSLGAEIYAIDNFSYIDSQLAKKKLDSLLKNVNVIEGDVSENKTWINVPQNLDYIFHFAAPSSIMLFKKYPEKCYRETVFGFWNVLEFAKFTGVKKVIYPSSGSNYAGNEMPHREDISVRPRNLYAAAKVACEGLASSYSDFVKSVGLRIFGGYGPGEEWKKDFGSVLYMFIRDYMQGKQPEVWGNGEQTRDFVYIDDIVNAAIKSAEIDSTGVINVGTGNSVSFKELLEIVKNQTKSEQIPRFVPKEKDYVENLMADTTLMRNLLQIDPLDVNIGVEKFVNYLRTGGLG